jgi:hypothetical protein
VYVRDGNDVQSGIQGVYERLSVRSNSNGEVMCAEDIASRQQHRVCGDNVVDYTISGVVSRK